MTTPRAAFDPQTLTRTQRMVGRRAAGEIVDLFLEHAPSELDRLLEAASTADCEAAARAAHSLRASAFNVGALQLYDVAGRMERSALANDAASLGQERDGLRDAFDGARAGLGAWRRGLDTVRIAVIEDNADNRVLARAILESSYEVVEFDSGPAALEALPASPPSLVLLDISLPDLDGVEVLRRLRAIESLRTVPVIALTAHAMADDRQRLLDEGFDEYVSKPIVDERDLLDPIERLLGRTPEAG